MDKFKNWRKLLKSKVVENGRIKKWSKMDKFKNWKEWPKSKVVENGQIQSRSKYFWERFF